VIANAKIRIVAIFITKGTTLFKYFLKFCQQKKYKFNI
jgi:hypothetical protein